MENYNYKPMRNFTLLNSENTPNSRNEQSRKLNKGNFASLISVISLIFNFNNWRIKEYQQSRVTIGNSNLLFSKKALLFISFLFSIGNVSVAQNAPAGEDKYYMLVGELINGGASTDVYQYTTGGGITSCSLSGGGGEGMVIDPTENKAYIATCCNQGEVRVYNYNTASFETPIALPGEDILDDYNVELWKDYVERKKSTKQKGAVVAPKDISMSPLYPHCDVITNRAVHTAIPVKRIACRHSPIELIYG